MWSHTFASRSLKLTAQLMLLAALLASTGCRSCDEPPESQVGDGARDQDSSGEMDLVGDMGQQGDLGPAVDQDSGVDADTSGEDDEAPVVMISSSMVASATGDYVLEGRARDDRGITSLTYRIGGGEARELTLRGDRFAAALTLVDDPSEVVVLARDAAGNTGEGRVTVRFDVASELTASFEVEGMPWLYEPLVFDASSSVDPLGQALTFTWEFGDGGLAMGWRVGHVYEATEEVTITLTARAEDGREATATRAITIQEATPQGTAVVSGVVLDDEGAGVFDAQVMSRDGSLLTSTNTSGYYEVEVGRGIPLLLQFGKEGWVTQLGRVEVPLEFDVWRHDTSMLQIGAQEVLEDVSQEATITLASGARLSFPPSAFVDVSGEVVQGQVNVKITPITPRGGEVSGFPGGFDALDEARLPTTLITHGVLHVELEQAGERVRLGSGVTATIEIPMGTQSAAVGDTIELWSLDERSGLWIRDGEGEVVTNARRGAERALRATVSHFSFWNVDEPITLVDRPIRMDWGVTPPADFNTRVTATQAQGRSFSQQSTVSTIPLINSTISESVVQTPRDLDAIVEGYKRRGAECLYFFEEITAMGMNPPTAVELDVRDLASDPDSELLQWDSPRTFALSPSRAGEQRYFLRYPDAPGQFVKLTARSISGGQGRLNVLEDCTGVSTHRVEISSGLTTERIIHPSISSTRGVILTASNTGEVELTLERVDMPTEGTGELHQVVDLVWEDQSSRDVLVYLNKDQMLHMALRGDAPPLFEATLIDPDLRLRALSASSPYTPSSRVYEARRSGWHRVIVRPTANPEAPSTYQLVLGEVLPERIFTYNRDSYRPELLEDRIRTLREGDVQRFRARKGGSQGIFVSPVLAPGEEGAQPLMRGNFTRTSGPSPDATLSTYGMSLAGGSPVDITFDIYERTLLPIDYQLKTDLLNAADTLRAGSLPCADPHTPYPLLAAGLVRAGGTVELCPGLYNVANGLFLPSEGVRFRGVGIGPSSATIGAWPNQPPIMTSRHIVELNNLTLLVNGTSQTVTYITTDYGPFIARDLIMRGFLGDSAAARALLLQTSGVINWEALQSPTTIENVRLEVEAGEGLYVENVPNLFVKNLSVSNAFRIGAAFSNISYATLEDITVERAEVGLNLGGTRSHANTIRGVHISDFNDPRIRPTSTVGVRITNGFPNGESQEDHAITTLSDVVVELGAGGQRGIVFSPQGGSPSTFHVDRCLVDGGGLASVGLEVGTTAGGGGELRVTNSVLTGLVQHVIHVLNANRIGKVELWHNSFRLVPGANLVLRDMVNMVQATDGVNISIINNIFIAYNTIQVSGIDIGSATLNALTTRYNLFHQVIRPYERGDLNYEVEDNQDRIHVDPMVIDDELRLDPLSPAVDTAPAIPFIIEDYSGIARPQGAGPDIGAHER